MRFYYAEKTLHRALDEAEFWKRQEAEHTNVIRTIVPNLESHFTQILARWGEVFSQTEGAVVQYIELLNRSGHEISKTAEGEILQLLHCSLQQSRDFVAFLGQMVNESSTVQTNPLASTVIHHIRRESEYYIGITQAVMEHYLSR
ncbi:MAG TPA: DUF2935 domain-containing protein [Bacillota bacterium]|nr:DUF2935 domain-containing protein [Bacillota bacterium]HPT86778.1 DUF2935 domain-containing protein [Bacillota bacterium]